MVVDLAGTRTTPRAWAASLNLTHRPGVVLFDSGKEAARINDRQQDLLRQGINIDFSE